MWNFKIKLVSPTGYEMEEKTIYAAVNEKDAIDAFKASRKKTGGTIHESWTIMATLYLKKIKITVETHYN